MQDCLSCWKRIDMRPNTPFLIVTKRKKEEGKGCNTKDAPEEKRNLDGGVFTSQHLQKRTEE